jgi:hypothetical protein
MKQGESMLSDDKFGVRKFPQDITLFRKLMFQEAIVGLPISDTQDGVHLGVSLKRVEKNVSEQGVEQGHATLRRGLEKRCLHQTMIKIQLWRNSRIVICTHARSTTSDIS